MPTGPNELCEAMDAVAPKPGPQGPYKKTSPKFQTETLPHAHKNSA